jgi:hypothetical protein
MQYFLVYLDSMTYHMRSYEIFHYGIKSMVKKKVSKVDVLPIQSEYRILNLLKSPQEGD